MTPEEISADENADKDAVEVLRAKLARKHEAQAVAEFQERLDFNMKRVRILQIMHITNLTLPCPPCSGPL